MARLFAPKPIPAFVAALPFLFTRSQPDDFGWSCRAALAAAAAAERADDTRRNTRGRVAALLCELGFQLARRDHDVGAELPLSRMDIANALDVGLSRVKRALALLQLSRVIELDSRQLRISDWRRLCGVAGYDPRRLQLQDEDEDGLVLVTADEPDQPRLTAAGDQACFV